MKDPLNKITYVKDFAKKNPHEWWAIKAIVTATVLCIIIMLFIKGCDDTPVVKPKTTAEIKKEVTEFVKPIQAKIDSFKQVIADSSKRVRDLEQKLYAAEQKIKWLQSSKKPVFNNPDSSRSLNTPQSVNGTAQDYTDLSTACENYVTEAKGVINNLHTQLDNKDSIITQSELQTQIYKHGFDQIALNSQAKDGVIKDLNKKLRVKKVTGFLKTVAIAAGVVFVIVKK